MEAIWARRATRRRASKVHPPPEVRTSNAELLGTTTGIILTAIVAVAGLVVLIGMVFWADTNPDTRRLKVRRRGEISGSAPRGEVSAGQGDQPRERIEHRHVPEGGHPHGKPSSWALVAVVIAAFITGGVAIMTHAWWLFWACTGIVVLAIPAGKAIGIMDDTVAWGSTPAATRDPSRDPEADPAGTSEFVPVKEEPGQSRAAPDPGAPGRI